MSPAGIPWKSIHLFRKSKTSPSVPIRSGGIFDYDTKKERLTEVELELGEAAVWEKPEYAQQLGRERASLERVVSTIEKLYTGLGDSRELLDLAQEADDEEMLEELRGELERLGQALKGLEFQRMFSGAMDANNAYLDIQAGSG